MMTRTDFVPMIVFLGCTVVHLSGRYATADSHAETIKTHTDQLVDDLKLKIDVDGPFTPERYTKLAVRLKHIDEKSPADRELVANTQDFLQDKLKPAMFVTYLDDVLIDKPVAAPQGKDDKPTVQNVDPQAANAWATRYLNAQYITSRDFLAGVRSVRLEIKPDAGLLEQLDAPTVERITTAALREYGIAVDPKASIALVVDPHLDITTLKRVVTSNDPSSNRDDSQQVSTMTVSVNFSVRTRCLREGEFIEAMVYPLSTRSNGHMVGPRNADAYSGTFVNILKSALNGLKAEVDEENEAEQQSWKLTRWPESKNAALYTTYTAEAPKRGNAPAFKGVSSISSASFDLLDSADGFLNADKAQTILQTQLKQAGINSDDASPFLVVHEVDSIKNEHTLARELSFDMHMPLVSYAYNIDNIWAFQRDVVFEFNGQVRRRCCAIWSRQDVKVGLLRDNEGTVREMVSRSNEALIERLSTGSR